MTDKRSSLLLLLIVPFCLGSQCDGTLTLVDPRDRSVTPPQGDPFPPPAPQTFRVASFNIHQGWGPDWEDRPYRWNLMLDQMASVHPSVMLMQEAIVGLDTNLAQDPVDHPKDAQAVLGLVPTFTSRADCFTLPPSSAPCGQYGIAALTPKAPSSVLTGSFYQVLVFEDYVIANVHFECCDFERGRVEDALALLDVLAAFPRAIVGGDFNAYLESEAVQSFLKAGFSDCGLDEHWHIDHFLVRGFSCTPVQTLLEETSDHRLIYTDMTRL